MNPHRTFKVQSSTLLCCCVVAFLSTAAGHATESETEKELSPRTPLKVHDLTTGPAFDHQLIVKFMDSVRARAEDDGRVVSLAGHDLGLVDRIHHQHSAKFEQLIQLPDPTLAVLEARAAARSGMKQPDLAGLMVVRVGNPSMEAMVAAARDLESLSIVEFVYLEPVGIPPPEDIPPATPNLVGLQVYRGPNPGLDIDAAWALGGRGGGVRLADCEYGWNPTHEDLNEIDLHLEPGQTIDPQVFAMGWEEHGTAVVGETSAMDNAYGCSGMVPDAFIHTYPEWTLEGGFRRVTAIANAIANSNPGDIVLLEMQTTGAGGGYGPAELNPAVWIVVKNGTDAGVIVIGAAGNGSQDLDSPPYQEYLNRGDSGAVIVGAGSADLTHARLGFSTYGSRVNLQGWGTQVFSLGYGTHAQYGGDRNQRYTNSFGGTSSASPFVASACGALQSIVRQQEANLSPAEIRDLLIDTGIPQGSGGHIGPFPNLASAISDLPARLPACDPGGPYDGVVGQIVEFDGSGSIDPDGVIISYTWGFGDGDTGTGPSPTHIYQTEGVFNVSLEVVDNRGNSAGCATAATVRDVTATHELADAESAVLSLRPVANPFSTNAAIRFDLSEGGMTRLSIYSSSGRIERELLSGFLAAGSHIVHWDGADDRQWKVASGVYFCRLEVEGRGLTRRLVLVR